MKRKIPIITSLSVLSLAIFIKAANFSLVEQLQLKTFDTFQISKPREYQDLPVKIIDIDDESLKKIGQWPWPRNKLAKLIARLNLANVSAIAMDIVFAEEDRTSPKNILPLWNREELSHLLNEIPDHDQLFSEAIANANVVSGFVLTQENKGEIPTAKAGFSYAGDDPRSSLSSFTGAVNSLPKIENAANGNGALNSIPDKDGILRRMPLIFTAENKFLPSLTAEALRIAQGASGYIIKSTGSSDERSYGQSSGITAIKIGNFEIPTDASGKFWIYYTKYSPERYIPAWKVLDPDFDISFLEGQIVYIGTSAAGLRDIRSTPLNPTTSGVEVHVQALEQILTENYLKRPDWINGAEIALMILVGLILIAITAKLSALWSILFTITSLAGAVGFSWYSFINYGILIDPITPGIAILLLYISESLSRYISSEREKKEVRNAFSHYMSPALVAQLAANPESLKLGGETKNLTMLFCDIRGFTTISEGFDAQGLTQFINKFLTPMTTIILDRQGTIDKYMGDCIMAFWNAPLDDPEHPKNACKSALEMIKALDNLNRNQKKEAQDTGRKFVPINIGIGLNTGDCCVGNMGSDQRFDYSVLGDDVNLASRLEGQSKNYGVNIVIGEKTHNAVSDFATIELDLITVKGKTKPVHIFTLLGYNDLAEKPAFKEVKELFNGVLANFRGKNWKQAGELIESCRKKCEALPEINLHGLLELYEERIAEFRKSPPPENWDGVFVATSK